MRELIMWNLLTLDGFFEGPKSWDLDFHNYVWGDELERYSIEQSKEADTLLFGRVTYEGMAAYWRPEQGEIADFMNGVEKVVVSRTLDKADWNNTRLVKDRAMDAIADLKQQPGRAIFVFGSANLSASLAEHGLFDEYRLCLVPVVLGSGNPLFREGAAERRMKLLEARPLQTGGVILRYRPERAAAA